MAPSSPDLRSEMSVFEENARLRQKVSELETAALSQQNHSTSVQSDSFVLLKSENAKLQSEIAKLRSDLLVTSSSNEQFRLIADYSPVLIALVDPDERYVFMNRLYQKWFGFEPEKAIGKTILEVAGSYAREKVKEQIQAALRGHHVHFENPVTLMSGGAKTVDLQFIPVWYPTKNANGFVILGYDITDRKLSESRILEIQDRLEFALKSAGMSSWHLDVGQNQPTASDLKSQLSNVVQIIQDRVHPDDAEETLRALKASIHERKLYDHEYRRLQPDGTYRWMASRAMPKYDVNGEPVSISGVTMDIAERKLSADRYRATTELTPQFIWISNEKGAITYSNSTLLNYMGVSESDALADRWVERLHPDDRENTLRVWNESLSQCKPYEIEFRIRAKDGSYGWFLNRALPMREKKDGPVDRWLGVSTDITKLKETEFALTQSEERFSFLYEASSILSSSLNYNETLTRLAEIAVPRLADWCSISVAEEPGPKTIALSHPDPAMKKVAEDFRTKYPTDWSSDRGEARVLRTGKPELHEWVTDDMIVASAQDPEHLRLIRALKIRSVMIVPIMSRGETLGVLTLVSSGDDRKYTETDLKIAEEVGKRAGLAIDNARLFTQVELERAKLSTIFAQAPVGIGVLEGPNHVISMVNSYYSSLFYGGRNDFVGKSVQEALPEAVEQGFVDILNRVYQTGEPFVGKEIPIDLLQSDGANKHFYINFVYHPLRNVDQEIYGIVAVIQDATEQVQSKATLETIFQESPAAMVLWKGPDLVFDKINPGYQAIFGDRELLGKPFSEALPETKGQPFEQWIKHVFETGEKKVQPEMLAKLVTCRGGPIEDRYFDMYFVQVMGVDNKPYGVYEHAVDVTDKVRAREAIQNQKIWLEEVLNRLPIGLIMAEPETGNYRFINQAGRLMLGQAPEAARPEFGQYKLIARDLSGRILSLDETPSARAARGEKVINEVIMLDKGETRIFVSCNSNTIPAMQGQSETVLVPFVDISDLKAKEFELKTVVKDLEGNKCKLLTTVNELERERELREQFVSTLTHDLRNPLAAAKLSAQLLSRSGNAPDKLTSLSGRIVDSIARANQMIENLLDANRIKAGEKLPLVMRETGLFSLLGDTINELAIVLGDRFVLKAENSIINGYWSEDGLRRIVENLCANAVKYGSERTPITVTLVRHGNHVSISVHNMGNPIPPNELNTLFDPFKRATTANLSSGKGWGLGLTLVRGLTEAHSGRLEVESSAEQGTTFTVILPLDPRRAENAV